MRERYRIVRLGNRNGGFYCKDTLTGSRTSLETKSRPEAVRLVRHRNEALQNPHINRKIGMAYLSASDPMLAKRVWQDVMDDIILDKGGADPPSLEIGRQGCRLRSPPPKGRGHDDAR